ncbi:hypothetical protein DBR43_02750 [Pedobacter sp. KBW06]|uniref:hypothetical protein n=1 Tax=Pedobacter sp. KBW06 TaxID=2153359 RepID=UPI000F5AF42F|nr:hypothetical protein [Pedobacter sp. KBW06]RQO74332.1 hypothetical protein DBR43_02750 [Pedobacter sp. KBW06]
MNILIEYPVPDWIKILFLLAIPAPVILTMFLARSAFSRPGSTAVFNAVGAFFFMYVLYVVVMGSTGKFNSVSFPPKVLLLTTFPFAFFLFLFVAKTKWYKVFIEHVSLERLVQVHVFRLIGGFFLILSLYDALPGWFGLIAGTGDVLTAISGIWVSKLIREKRLNFKKVTWVWNTFGLIDILFTAVSANVLTKLSIDSGIMGVDTLAMFPFYFIPALAPPIIVFLHYSIYLKLKKPVELFS